MIVLESYKCRNCGHIFIHHTGGFIMKLSVPTCPKCGSTNVKEEKK